MTYHMGRVIGTNHLCMFFCLFC
uniref:Uncharacterized protein n=1 Tax=Rhizophora mucronata TaxID=61149 RepID=A0A2P2NCN4_RHIMU